MKIESIHALNLKGRSFQHKLGGITIFAGPNSSGKTAVADAIQLLLMACHPHHPKTAAGIFNGLSSGNPLTVSGEIRNFGETIRLSRSWRQKGRGISTTFDVPDTFPETPLVQMDSREYFGQSDAKRVTLAFSMLELSDPTLTPAAIAKEAEAAAENEKKVTDIVTKDVSWPLQQWLEWCGDELEVVAKSTREDIARFTKTLQGITELQTRDDLVDVVAINSALETAKADAKAAVEELERKRGQIEQAQKQAGPMLEKLARRNALLEYIRASDMPSFLPQKSEHDATDISNALVQCNASLQAAERHLLTLQHRKETHDLAAAQAKEIQERLAELRAENEQLRPRAECYEKELEIVQKLTRDIELIGDIQAEEEEAAEASKKATARKTELATRYKTTEAEIETLKQQHNELASFSCCPTCGATGRVWSADTVERFEAKIEDKKQQLVMCERDFSAAKEAAARADAALNDVVKKRQRLQSMNKSLGDHRQHLAEAQAAKKAIERNQAEAARRSPEFPQEEASLSAEITQQTERVSELREQSTLLTKMMEADRLGAECRDIPDIEGMSYELAALEVAADNAEEKRAALFAKQTAANNQLADERRQQQARNEVADAEQLLKRVTAAKAVVVEKRSEAVKKGMVPILRTANLFLTGIMPEELELREGEIGCYRQSNWVPNRSLAGCYQAITYGGIQIALAAAGKTPCRIVLMDEMFRVDRENKVRFLQNVANAIEEGLIEQFVGMDVDPTFYEKLKIPGLTLITTAD